MTPNCQGKIANKKFKIKQIIRIKLQSVTDSSVLFQVITTAGIDLLDHIVKTETMYLQIESQ